jgi:hypothetical protein
MLAAAITAVTVRRTTAEAQLASMLAVTSTPLGVGDGLDVSILAQPVTLTDCPIHVFPGSERHDSSSKDVGSFLFTNMVQTTAENRELLLLYSRPQPHLLK